MNKLIRFVAWGFVAVVLLLTAALAAISIWAATGTRDLSQYNKFIEDSINKALVGNRVVIGKTYLEWNHLDDLLSVKTEKVEVYDKDQNKIANLPHIILKYDILSLLTGSVVPSRLYLVAPVVDLTSLMQGNEESALDFEDFNLGRLKEVTILNGTLLAPGAGEWKISRATLRYTDEIMVDANMYRDDGQQLTAIFRTNSDQSDSYARLQFKNLDSNTLLYYVPEIENMRFIANGSGTFVSNKKEKLVSFKVDEMVGAIEKPEIFSEKLVIKAGTAEGSYDLRNEILDVKAFNTVFDDDFQLSGSTVITTFNTFVGDVNLSNLQLRNFKKYWPVPAAPNAIEWIREHVTDGVVTTGNIKLNLLPNEIETGILSPDSIRMNFEFKDVASWYLPKMQPVTKGSGTGTMNGTQVDLKIQSAVSGKSAITRADLKFTGLDQETSYLDLDAEIKGEAADMADFYIELGSGKKLLGSRDNITGKAHGNVKVNLPLNADLKIAEVKYGVKANISEGTVKNLFGKVDATAVKMTVTADSTAYAVTGESYATYNQPGQFTLVNAPISFEVASKGNGLRIAVASDITNSSAEFAALELKKTAGEPGKFVVEIVDNGQVAKLTKVMLSSAAIKLDAKGTLKKDYSNFSSLELAAKFGKSDIVGRISNNQSLSIDLKGAYLDAAPIIRHLKKDDDGKEDDSQFKLRLKADEIGLMNGQSLKNAFVTLSCAKDCDVISLNSEKVSFNQTSTSLNVKASNAGSLLKGFDIYDNMLGGELEIKASVKGSDYDGRMTITDFSIVKAQTLAKMLSLGSLTGIADAVRGKGIGFKKLSSDFVFTKKKIAVKEFRMVGSAIGITAKGEINRENDNADLSGNVIPAYTANTLLGKIPLLGDVIIGSDGVFALAYSLKGNMDDPKLSVNPLSVLAPGFLKNIFQ